RLLADADCIGIACTKAGACDRRKRTRAESVVVEPLGELQRGSRVRLCGGEALSLAHLPGKPLVNPGLELRIACRLAKRAATQTNVALDVAEQYERFRARPPLRCLVEQ